MKNSLIYILTGKPKNIEDAIGAVGFNDKRMDIIPRLVVYEYTGPKISYSISIQVGDATNRHVVPLNRKELGDLTGTESEVLFKILEKAVEIAEELERRGINATIKGRGYPELQEILNRYAATLRDKVTKDPIAELKFNGKVRGAYINYDRHTIH